MNQITKDTRLSSYLEIIGSGDRARQYQNILGVFLETGEEFTAREMVNELFKRHLSQSLERNVAAPRFTELEQAGILEISGKKKCPVSGRMVATYRLN